MPGLGRLGRGSGTFAATLSTVEATSDASGRESGRTEPRKRAVAPTMVAPNAASPPQPGSQQALFQSR